MPSKTDLGFWSSQLYTTPFKSKLALISHPSKESSWVNSLWPLSSVFHLPLTVCGYRNCHSSPFNLSTHLSFLSSVLPSSLLPFLPSSLPPSLPPPRPPYPPDFSLLDSPSFRLALSQIPSRAMNCGCNPTWVTFLPRRSAFHDYRAAPRGNDAITDKP